jgi:hypothetical protein
MATGMLCAEPMKPRCRYWFLAESYIKQWMREYMLDKECADLDKGSDIVSIMDTQEGCTYNFKLKFNWGDTNDESPRFLLNVTVKDMGIFKNSTLPFESNKTVSQFFMDELYQDTFHFISDKIIPDHNGLCLQTEDFAGAFQGTKTKIFIACHSERFCLIKCRCAMAECTSQPYISVSAKFMDREDIEYCILYYIFPEFGLEFEDKEMTESDYKIVKDKVHASSLGNTPWKSNLGSPEMDYKRAFSELCVHYNQSIPRFLK